MPNRKGRSRNRRRRNKRQGSGRAISQVASGLPVTIRTRRTDPPTIPTLMDQSVRLRFLLYLQEVDTSPGTRIIWPAPEHPGAPVVVLMAYTAPSFNTSPAISIIGEELMDAASYRVFARAMKGDANLIKIVDGALTKVEFYSPADFETPVRMSVRYGDGIPNFLGIDSGDKLKRAVVSSRPPRLVWYKFDSNQDSAPVINVIYTVPGHSWKSRDYTEAGVLDCTMRIRRTATMVVQSSSGRTYFEANALGEILQTTTPMS